MQQQNPFTCTCRWAAAALLALLALCVGTAHAAPDTVVRPNLSANGYQQAHERWAAKGYRLRHVSAYAVGQNARFAAIWALDGGPPQVARHGLSADEYQATFEDLKAKGYRAELVDAYLDRGQVRYAALWEKRSGHLQAARHGMTAQEYQQEATARAGSGWRLTWVDGVGVGAQAYYAAFWEKAEGNAPAARHGMDSDTFDAEQAERADKGFRLVHVNSYTVGSTVRYAAIWDRRAGPAQVLRTDLDAANQQTALDNAAYRGDQAIQISGATHNGQARYTTLFRATADWNTTERDRIDTIVRDYMRANRVPGAALAITKDERLVYAQGWGWADRDAKVEMGPRHLFRIASVSKPITAVAVMMLVEQGKLKLDDKVFGEGALLGTTYGSKPYGSRERDITVGQLLMHDAGGLNWSNEDDNTEGDPMFQKGSFDHAQLIGWVLDERDPSAAPGRTHHYSNFGYSVLGRVIEKVTGQGYEHWVKSWVLAPANVSDMHIGGDTEDERRDNEVRYYDSDYNPYGMKVRRMDAHGGWIASPIDMMRFMVHVDGFPRVADLLKPATRAEMIKPSPVASDYAKGWRLGTTGNWKHGGFLPGQRSLLWRTTDGYNMFFVINRTIKDEPDQVVAAIRNEVRQWPAFDLFQQAPK